MVKFHHKRDKANEFLLPTKPTMPKITIRNAVQRYLKRHSQTGIRLKAVLFDMDGVLFNSMPYHAEAWNKTMEAHGLHLSVTEAYLNEGRTGASTINTVYQRQYGTDAPESLINQIYAEKAALFHEHGETLPMNGAQELLRKLQSTPVSPVLVTGSGQVKLIDTLAHYFPHSFEKERMVTAFDVKYGKPNPEPYLIGLSKVAAKANEAIVVENAPLGVEAGHAAGIFTVAVNTGPIDGQVLLDAGADLLYPSMQALCDGWELLYNTLKETTV